MRTIAFETTTTGGTLAGLVKGHVLEQVQLDPQAKAAKSFAPALHQLLRQLAWRPKDIQCVAVAQGPGSFTGLRIGVTAAKTLAYATGAMLVGINTLEAIAHRAPLNWECLEAALPAHRQQVFAASFQRGPEGQWVWRTPTRVLDEDAWLAQIPAHAAVSGPALEYLQRQLPAHASLVPPECWAPTAGSVGELAWKLCEAGRHDDVFQLVPSYFRLSAAEEKWSAEHRQAG